jgi:hypothetical protein
MGDRAESYKSLIGYRNPVLSNIAKKMFTNDYSSLTTTERLLHIERRS